jgi:hypothetical protein
LQHTSEISETLETYVYNMCFQRNISLLLGNGCSSVRVAGVEFAGGTKLIAPVEKAVAVRVLEKPVVGGKHSGERGRQATVLWCGGVAGRWSGGALEREAWWRKKRGGESHH